MSTDTLAWADKLDFDDPQTLPSERDEASRALLTRRLNAVPQPSLEINHIHQSQARGRESASALSGLIGRAPRVLGIVRSALREAFDLDPDALLFTEPLPPAPAQKIYSLTERALALLIQPEVPLNINLFTSVSLKDDPLRSLPFTAWDALVRVKALGLLGRIERTQREYWQSLAHGSWLTRRERWGQLRTSVFAEQAFLAHRVSQLTDSGYDMLRQLLQIPDADLRQQAGGEWAAIQVSHIMWPGTNRALVPIPGAMHIYRDGVVGATPQVVYLPGLFREFYEFSSWNQLQCDLPVLVNGALSSVLWQCLPLRRRHELCNTVGAVPITFARQRGDALQNSASQLLEGQWDNELACAFSINHAAVGIQGVGPSAAPDIRRFLRFIEKGRRRLVAFTRLGHTLDTLLKWDEQRRNGQIVCGGSLAADLAFKTQQAQLKRYEQGLMALLDAKDVSNDSAAYQDFLRLEGQWQGQVEAVRKWTQSPPERVFHKAYWLERVEGRRRRNALVVQAQHHALLGEVQMQQRLNLLSRAHLDCLEAALSKTWMPGKSPTDTCVLQVAVGCEATPLHPLLGAAVVTLQAARTDPEGPYPVLLYVMGQHGGFVAFDSLNAFAKGLQASLESRDGSVLWRCIGRDQREAVRTAIGALPEGASLVVTYTMVERYMLKDLFIKQMQHHAALNARIDQGDRLFSEVSDPQLSRMLLAQQLFECLQVPSNDARTLALANINLLQEAANQAKKLPGWLATASKSQRKHHKRLSRRYLTSVWAVERKLWKDLPDLTSFARKVLVARLTADGFYPQLDIDKPLLDLPDDVSSQLCGWSSQCAVGDRNTTITVSKERTTFSLLQLALHNLDPEAPWTRWRLNRARWLDPAWKQRLNVRYLIKMIASLDVGGEYDKQIRRAFYPPASTDGFSFGLSQALVYRALQQCAEVQLYSATQQGLSDKAQRLFTVAMAARVAGDLKADGFDVQLAVLRLVGVTLEHDRHVAGVLVIHDTLTGLCVVYWPTAVASPVIVEYASLAEAEQALNRIGALPANVKELARQVAPGWEFQALESYGESLHIEPRQPYSAQAHISSVERLIAWFVEWFTVKHKVPAVSPEGVEAQVQEQIVLQPHGWLAIVPTTHGNPMALLAHAWMFDLQRRTQASANCALALKDYRERRLGEQFDATIRGLLSFVPGLGIGISVYEMLLAARRYHFSGSAHDAVDVVFLTLFAFHDVTSSFAPGPKGARAARVALPRYKGNVVALSGLKASRSQPTHLLARFKSSEVLEGAVELKGPQSKSQYVKNGQQLIVEGGDLYPVYQREAESVLRLKNQQDELVLNIHQSREWLLGADAPQPGPSSGVLNPWQVPAQSLDWRPSASARNATQTAILQTTSTATHWYSWRISPQEVGPISHSPSAGVFHIAQDARGYPHNVLWSAAPNFDPANPMGSYFRLLPEGDQAPLSDIQFIYRNEPLVSQARTDIELWTSTALLEQPLAVSRTQAGTWSVHAPLFDRPLTDYVRRAFPTMTRYSRELTVARMIELSGPRRPATASHMLNIRATLDDWLPPLPAKPGQTDDLLRMLHPHELDRMYIHIGFDGKAPGFTRVDFTVSLESRLQHGGRVVEAQREVAQRAAVKGVLKSQGFDFRELQVQRYGKKITQELIATHPNSPNQLYYVAYQWLEKGSITIGARFEDRWFHANPSLSDEVKSALRGNRLVRIMAGIQWPTFGRVPPSVYFIKMVPIA